MRLLRYLPLSKASVMLGAYILLSVIFMNFSDPASLRGVRWGVLQVVTFFNGMWQGISRWSNLEAQRDRLVEENFYLHVTNQQLREMVLENARLRRLLNLKEQTPYEYISAKIIGHGPEKSIESLILNVGLSEGVERNMAVLNADGLVGKVIWVTRDHAKVQILKDRNAFVSARLEKSREVGTISWSGGDFFELLYIPNNIEVSVGEQVITSNFGEIYPPGIPIGIVSRVEKSGDDMFHRILVQPAVNFKALEEVFVIRKKDPETKQLD